MVKPRIGSALKVVDAQIVASRESSTESWVSVEMAAVGLRLRWSAVQARKPSRRKPPRWPRRAGNLPIIVGELDNRDVLPSPSKNQIFKFFLIFSHDFVKVSNFDEFKN